jgi:hypothetical protein
MLLCKKVDSPITKKEDLEYDCDYLGLYQEVSTGKVHGYCFNVEKGKLKECVKEEPSWKK